MRLIVILLSALAVCSALDTDSSSGTDTGNSEGSGQASAGGGATADTNNNAETSLRVESTASATQAGTSATATGDASATVAVGVPSGSKQPTETTTKTTTPFIDEGEGISENVIDTSTTTKTQTTQTTTTHIDPPVTPPPEECPEGPKRCNHCEQEGFNGFSFAPGKCDCCPWPCCCKCVQIAGPQPECSRLIDLGIILDASGSIGTEDWVRTKEFVKDVASAFNDIGNDQHVAMVTFSTDATLEWDFNGEQTSSKADLLSAIDGLQNVGQFTNTADAIEIANDEVFVPSGGDNPEANNVALLITDGRPNFRRSEIPDLASELRSKASTVCVGVTDKADLEELKQVCDEDRIFIVDQFKDLHKILKRLQTKICPTPPSEERCLCCCSPEQYFGAQGFW